MYTFADICNIAIQIERNGEREYQKAARNTSDNKLKKLYTQLAKQEDEHAIWFAELLRQKASPDAKQQQLNDISATMLQNIIKDARFPADGKELDEIDDPTEAIKFAIALEEDTIAFYQFVRELVEDEKTRIELQQIIEEEKQHAIILKEAMKDEP